MESLTPLISNIHTLIQTHAHTHMHVHEPSARIASSSGFYSDAKSVYKLWMMGRIYRKQDMAHDIIKEVG